MPYNSFDAIVRHGSLYIGNGCENWERLRERLREINFIKRLVM